MLIRLLILTITVSIGFCYVPSLQSIANAAEMRGLRVVAKDTASGQTGEVDDHDKDIHVVESNIGLLFPAYLPTCEWIDIALFLQK